MKAFSTSSARMTLVRKDGYYMSLRTATAVVKKLTPVYLLSQQQIEFAIQFLTGFHTDEAAYQGCLSGNECEALIRLRSWYSLDTDTDIAVSDPVFVAVDLNSGRACVISERKTRAPRPVKDEGSVERPIIQWELVPFKFHDLKEQSIIEMILIAAEAVQKNNRPLFDRALAGLEVWLGD